MMRHTEHEGEELGHDGTRWVRRGMLRHSEANTRLETVSGQRRGAATKCGHDGIMSQGKE